MSDFLSLFTGFQNDVLAPFHLPKNDQLSIFFLQIRFKYIAWVKPVLFFLLIPSSPIFGRPYSVCSWRREWLPTLVFWPGEFLGLYSPWGLKDSDMTEQLSLHIQYATGIVNFLPLGRSV